MMMMTEVAHHKRSYEGFLLSVDDGIRSDCCTETKRPKTGCGGGSGGGGGEGGSTNSIKERKDKIGERVGALQQLVSPFGKSDTASVLLEATEYIKFLRDQLQVLSAPYLRGTTGNPQESQYYSLRSRGLCLMPAACTLATSHTNGADIWAPIKTGDRKI